ncbi:MAG: hypothetical protein HGA67_01425 [Candidatus Yonathbacteria bacterium]|nr:hypothetical protein [Candidatus Yonathbacteria bacterium]
MKKLFAFFYALAVGVIFAVPASAVTVTGSVGYQRDYVCLKDVYFSGNLGVATVNLALGNGFAVNHWVAYDLSGDKSFVERDWSLVKSVGISDQIAGSMSVNLYNFRPSYVDLAHKGDVASLEANASMKVSPNMSLFGGAEALTFVSCPGDFTTAYAGMKLQTGKTFVKPRLQWLTNGSPFVRVDIGTSANVLGITVNPSAKFVFAEDRQPMAQAVVEVPF